MLRALGSESDILTQTVHRLRIAEWALPQDGSVANQSPLQASRELGVKFSKALSDFGSYGPKLHFIMGVIFGGEGEGIFSYAND